MTSFNWFLSIIWQRFFTTNFEQHLTKGTMLKDHSNDSIKINTEIWDLDPPLLDLSNFNCSVTGLKKMFLNLTPVEEALFFSWFFTSFTPFALLEFLHLFRAFFYLTAVIKRSKHKLETRIGPQKKRVSSYKLIFFHRQDHIGLIFLISKKAEKIFRPLVKFAQSLEVKDVWIP